MAPFGNYHHETGAGWSVYWRISQAQGAGLEICGPTSADGA
jgi:hypothetical protein